MEMPLTIIYFLILLLLIVPWGIISSGADSKELFLILFLVKIITLLHVKNVVLLLHHGERERYLYIVCDIYTPLDYLIVLLLRLLCVRQGILLGQYLMLMLTTSMMQLLKKSVLQ
jgi:hypothetical protein